MTEILRLSEAARIAGVCPATLRNAIKSEDGPQAVRLGRRWYGIPREALEAWIARRCLGPAQAQI